MEVYSGRVQLRKKYSYLPLVTRPEWRQFANRDGGRTEDFAVVVNEVLRDDTALARAILNDIEITPVVTGSARTFGDPWLDVQKPAREVLLFRRMDVRSEQNIAAIQKRVRFSIDESVFRKECGREVDRISKGFEGMTEREASRWEGIVGDYRDVLYCRD